MATSDIKVTEGSGKNVATNSISEDAETKQLQRIVVNKSDGTELATASNPFQVSLANTAANATAVKVDGSAVTQPVSASSLPLPTGASTSAKQPALGTAGTASTDVITVQGIASMTKLLVTPDSVALPANQSVNVNQLAGTATDTNSGNKSAGTLRVVLATDQPQLTNSLLVSQATGTNLHMVVDSGTVSTITNVVHVDDNSGSLTVDGTVTASIAAGATTIAKAEDSPSATADVGVPAMAIQLATPADTAGTDGDYAMLQMSAGRLWASTKIDTALPTGTNSIGDIRSITTSITPGTAAANLGKAEDGGHSSGDVGVMALAVRQDANTSLVGTDLDYAPFQVDANGSLKVAIISGAGSGGTAMADDAAFTVGTTNITPAGGTYKSTRDAVDDNDGGAFAMTAKRGLYVSLETPNADSAMDDTLDALKVVGGIAHDTAASGNPVLTAGEGRDTLGTAVTAGDVCRIATSRYGATLVSAYPPTHASSNGTPITATTTSVVAAPSAGNHLRVVRIHMSNGGATATWVAVRDGASGTQHYRSYLMQGALVSLDLNTSGVLDLTTATRLDIVLSAAGSVEYEIDYFTVAD